MSDVPDLGNGMPRVMYDPEDNVITVLVGEDIPICILTVDSGLAIKAKKRAAQAWTIEAKRVSPRPTISPMMTG